MTMLWKTTRYQVDLSQPQVMGIVNVTPDSFSDGGRLADDTAALRHCEQLLKDGAHLLDIGGESTRPGSPAVPLDEELARVLPVVRELMRHPAFQLRNPNRARSVVFSYCHGNPAAFHRRDAAGYVYWADRVLELDALNPQVAARLARAMDAWARLAEPYRASARAAIERVAAQASLSNDVREVVTRALAGGDAAAAAVADTEPEARTAPTPDTQPKADA